jgi:hypothetical protein
MRIERRKVEGNTTFHIVTPMQLWLYLLLMLQANFCQNKIPTEHLAQDHAYV